MTYPGTDKYVRPRMPYTPSPFPPHRPFFHCRLRPERLPENTLSGEPAPVRTVFPGHSFP